MPNFLEANALFWPREEALLVADLHLEKASWFARLGQFLPPYDSHATLTALSRQVEATGATRLYCLGDSFHDRFGCDRLPADARDSRSVRREIFSREYLLRRPLLAGVIGAASLARSHHSQVAAAAKS